MGPIAADAARAAGPSRRDQGRAHEDAARGGCRSHQQGWGVVLQRNLQGQRCAWRGCDQLKKLSQGLPILALLELLPTESPLFFLHACLLVYLRYGTIRYHTYGTPRGLK